MATSSESEGDMVWKRKGKGRVEISEEEPKEFWATPPRKRKEDPEVRPPPKTNAKKCLVRSCNLPVRYNARHIKYYHMPSFVDEAVDDSLVQKWVEFLHYLCKLLGLRSLNEMVNFVNSYKLHNEVPLDVSPRDKDTINSVAKVLGEKGMRDVCLRNISQKCQLVHWSIVVRMVDYLTEEHQSLLFAKFPSSDVLKDVVAKNFVIAGDSIVRHLSNSLKFDIPVICAPGVTMCSSQKSKWLIRLWIPIIETMLKRPKPHFIFHLGTNNISNGREDAPYIIKKEAQELCKRLWEFNRMLNITFSAVLFRSKAEDKIVMEVNHKLRELSESDDRIHFLDFSESLQDREYFRRDQLHLSDEGVKAFAKCFNEFFYKQYHK